MLGALAAVLPAAVLGAIRALPTSLNADLPCVKGDADVNCFVWWVKLGPPVLGAVWPGNANGAALLWKG